MNSKKLKVEALCNGTVIDHIPSDKLFKVISILRLDHTARQVTFGVNLESAKLETKGIVKVADTFFEQSEINKIALIAPNASLNIIRDYAVAEKRSVVLPNRIDGIICCANPRCITNNEPVATRFEVIKNQKVTLKCNYCDWEVNQENVKIK